MNAYSLWLSAQRTKHAHVSETNQILFWALTVSLMRFDFFKILTEGLTNMWNPGKWASSAHLGWAVLFSVFIMYSSWAPSAPSQWSNCTLVEPAKVPSLCSWSRVAETKDSNHLLVFVSVAEERSFALFKFDSINAISLTCTVDDHWIETAGSSKRKEKSPSA